MKKTDRKRTTKKKTERHCRRKRFLPLFPALVMPLPGTPATM
ncbi:MAG: hypothetical protein RBS27_15650 [Giesbergeria sp.]|nr:hypothetical protein [Giesbergeria sp.]